MKPARPILSCRFRDKPTVTDEYQNLRRSLEKTREQKREPERAG